MSFFFLAVLVFGVLALGPQVVLSNYVNSTFELSEVQQCEPVFITFAANYSAYTLNPTSLTLVPFNSTPVSIPISNTPSNISSVSVTFVPFAAGTPFLASLNDATGESVTQVSDIIQVLPSPTGNVSCLPKNQAATVNYLTVDNSTFSQCNNFTINYNHTALSRAPSVRLYSPEAPSSLLNLTSDDNTTGTATYLLSFRQSKEVVLVFNDDLGHKISSAIMTVGGDSSSSEDCLTTQNISNGSTTDTGSNASSPPSKTSMIIIIAASVGGGVVVLIVFCLMFLILRRRRRQPDIESEPAPNEKKGPTEFQERQLSTPPPVGDDQHFVKDPSYTHDSRQSMASWSQPTPNHQPFPIYGDRVDDNDDDLVSLKSLDIEGMLNLAAVQSTRSSISRSSTQTMEPMPFGPVYPMPGHNSSHSFSSPHPRKKKSRQHVRDSSDIPFGPESMASALSMTSVVDPFADDAIKRQGQVGLPPSRKNSAESSVPSPPTRKNSAESSIRSPPRVMRGLPTSPRDGHSVARERRVNVTGGSQDSSMFSALDVVLEDGPGDINEIAQR
ncbi:hypothetical protein C0991_007963 [Blastosporella zonata]|nr:hypothetical protein C0991_007963 [Blastosporella zonata]